MEENTKNKKVPYSIEKHKFFKMVHPLPENTAKRRINVIIFENRKNFKEYENTPKDKIINCRFIERVELIEYFETYGMPAGLEF